MTIQNVPAGSSPASSTAETGARPSLQARLVAVTLANQAGRALSASQTARSGR